MVGLDSSTACLREEKKIELTRAGQGFQGARDGSKRHRKAEIVCERDKNSKMKRRKKNQKTAKKSDEKKTFFSENFLVARIDP